MRSAVPFTLTKCQTCGTCSAKPLSFSLLGVDTNKPGGYVVSASQYQLYHTLQMEYLVEFSKNPMSWQTPESLPYCGVEAPSKDDIESTVDGISSRSDQTARLHKRGWWSNISKTIGKIGKNPFHSAL